jgi:ribose transport system substrate-binding protein
VQAAGAGPVIVLLPKTKGTALWDEMWLGASQTAAKLRSRVTCRAPEAESDYQGQALMLEDAITARPSGIILAPSHGSVLASGIRHARAQGIPLVLVESTAMVSSDEYLAYVGSDEAAIGTMAAHRAGQVLGGSGSIAILGVSPTIETTTRRERAFAQTISEHFPRIRLLDIRYGLGEHLRSFEIVRDICAAYPDVQLIFASDTMGTRGAYAALRNRRPPLLVGVAQDSDLRDFVTEGLIDSLVVQSAYAMGRISVEMLVDQIEGRRARYPRVETPIALATRANARSVEILDLVDRRRLGPRA